MTTYNEYLINYLENLSNDELLEVNNQYDEYDPIYYNDEDFFEMFSSGHEIARAIYYGDYKYPDNFVKINDLGNLESANFIDDLIDIDNLAYILEDANYLKGEYEETKKTYTTDQITTMYADNDNQFLEIEFDGTDILRVNYRDLPNDEILNADDVPTKDDLEKMLQDGEWQ